MKVQLVFTDLPIKPYHIFDKTVMLSILEKVNQTEIDLPFSPSKEMKIDLSTFDSVFNFSEIELEAIEDSNSIFDIKTIVITCNNIELWLD